MMNGTLKALIGLHIDRALLDDEVIYLVAGERIAKLEPEADCCASSYLQHVSLACALSGATITAIEDVDGGCEGPDGDVVDTWGHVIRTTKGTCSLELRTEHNGYYGGHLELSWVDDVPADAEPLEDF